MYQVVLGFTKEKKMKKRLLITLSLLGQTSLQTAKQVSENKTDITIIIQYGKMDSNFRKVSRIPFTLERMKSLKLSFSQNINMH